MPGMTAYMGLMDIGQPKSGETLVVAAASGAVGSVVGQVAKIKGLRVVGVAGGADKCRYVVEELGFDACIDHKSPDFADELAGPAPKASISIMKTSAARCSTRSCRCSIPRRGFRSVG
jgi:NADPH-dependent curcumin reductase CurA